MTERLSERLSAVVRAVPRGTAAIDVGCDHAFVPIALVRSGICPCALASDIRRGPLASAELHIEEAGLTDRIRTVLADGVPEDARLLLAEAGMAPGTEVTLITAGMGGLMMRDILRAAERDFLRYHVAVPQRDADVFRMSLRALGFSIRDEEMVEEDGKFYPVILSERGEDARPLSFEEALLGPVLMRRMDPVFLRYVRRRREQLVSVLRALPEREAERREKLLAELAAYGRADEAGGGFPA